MSFYVVYTGYMSDANLAEAVVVQAESADDAIEIAGFALEGTVVDRIALKEQSGYRPHNIADDRAKLAAYEQRLRFFAEEIELPYIMDVA